MERKRIIYTDQSNDDGGKMEQNCMMCLKIKRKTNRTNFSCYPTIKVPKQRRDQKSLENRGKRLGRPRDFCDLPIRRDEGRVVNTPLMFKRVLFEETGRERKKRREREEERESREREEPALDGEKGLVRDWSGKTMNARGVENGI
ncbi:hypothetical protein TNCV_835121 [Trichonephila clavipes]|nr:hypothetical protein TNCV_835121 [Trichonephila clavipes]